MTPELSEDEEVMVNDPDVVVMTPAALVEDEVGVIALTYHRPANAEVGTTTGRVFAITLASVTTLELPPAPHVFATEGT